MSGIEAVALSWPTLHLIITILESLDGCMSFMSHLRFLSHEFVAQLYRATKLQHATACRALLLCRINKKWPIRLVSACFRQICSLRVRHAQLQHCCTIKLRDKAVPIFEGSTPRFSDQMSRVQAWPRREDERPDLLAWQVVFAWESFWSTVV